MYLSTDIKKLPILADLKGERIATIEHHDRSAGVCKHCRCTTLHEHSVREHHVLEHCVLKQVLKHTVSHQFRSKQKRAHRCRCAQVS